MAEEEQQTLSKTGLYRLVMLAAVVLIASLAGFGAAKFLGGSSTPQEAAAGEGEPIEEPIEETNPDPGVEYSYYEFEAITVNLDEPRLARHVRAMPILAIKTSGYAAASAAVEKKKLELSNWLTVYLAGCSLEEVRGSKNLNRIQREIREAFNDQLWPGGAPLIDHVLFKEFKVQ